MCGRLLHCIRDGPLFTEGMVPERGMLRLQNLSYPCFYNIQNSVPNRGKGEKLAYPTI